MKKKSLYELDKELYKKYPKLLRQFKWPLTQTALCWGIVPGYGWKKIVFNMCRELEKHRRKMDKDLQLTQVKEKYGRLTVYYSNSKHCDIVDKIISKYESLSIITCIECGLDEGKLVELNGWIICLCKKCLRKRKSERL